MALTPYRYTSPYDPAREDDGLFGPDSVTWRIMNSRIMWVAVLRALYLQALHPRVIRGTLQNAATITEPVDAWARLRRTRTFIETRTFGTTAEAERAGRRVRKIHEPLTGTDPDGTRFRVDEPDLLLWVHCGEVASCVDIARRSRLPFSVADLDAFVAEQRASAELIGIDRNAAPASLAELNAATDLPSSGAPRQPRAEAGAAAGRRPGVLDAAGLGAADVRRARRSAERPRGDRRAPCHANSVQPAAAVPGRHTGHRPRRDGRLLARRPGPGYRK